MRLFLSCFLVFFMSGCSVCEIFSVAPTSVTTSFVNFMPENDLSQMDELDESYQITQAEFEQQIELAKEFFAPIAAAHGAKLEIVGSWRDSTVNASASKDGSHWVVRMYGGLARRPEISRPADGLARPGDSFLAVIMHEVGHLVGGYPFYPGYDMAAEGQGDYFATHAGLRALWLHDVEGNAAAAALIPAYPKAECNKVYELLGERDLCYRAALAGKSLADLLAALGGKKVSWDKKDPTVVTKTFPNHPASQCRMDTYLAGALCPAVWDFKVIPQGEVEAAKYSCKEGAGARPRCWFKP